MKILDLLHGGYDNKYLIYCILLKFYEKKYLKMGDFCDDFIVVFRELNRDVFTDSEYRILNGIDSVVQLYSPYDADLAQGDVFLSGQDVTDAIHPLLLQLGIIDTISNSHDTDLDSKTIDSISTESAN